MSISAEIEDKIFNIIYESINELGKRSLDNTAGQISTNEKLLGSYVVTMWDVKDVLTSKFK